MAMKHPSALGIALLVLVAVTTVVGPSSANNTLSFAGTYKALSAILSQVTAQDVMAAYQRQTNIISLEGADLDEPHLLSINAPVGTILQASIAVDDHPPVPLKGNGELLDIRPYLRETITRITIVGTYSPATTVVTIGFSGPNTTVQQQTGGTGQIHYQLNLLVQ
jgi:hypothetical protein